jgi:Short repeat of unknown function (DUF308)
MDDTRGGSAIVLAGTFLILGGVLNVIYGIAAISNSKFFLNDTKYIISDLKTWGWIVLIIGILELFAAFSLLSGKTFGRWVGLIVGSLNAISALLSIPAYPLWSLAIFALSLWIIYGLAVYWEPRPAR